MFDLFFMQKIFENYVWPRRESNADPGLRRPLYYPLYYEAEGLTIVDFRFDFT